MNPDKYFVWTFEISLGDKACTYSAFDESETAAELRIRTRYGVPAEATFRLLEKRADRRYSTERRRAAEETEQNRREFQRRENIE